MLDRQHRDDGEIRSKTLNLAQRTVEVRFSTENPVLRHSPAIGKFNEVLECTDKAMDLSRADAGMMFLDSHNSLDTAARLGGVVKGSIRCANGEAFATIKLSRTDEAERVLRDLQDGIPVPISVGYRILETERVENDDDDLPTIRATKWQPYEISAVSVPADPSGQARADAQEDTMTDKTKSTSSTQNRQVLAERDRISQIRSLGARFKKDEEFITQHIDNGTSVAAYRNMILDQIVDEDEGAETLGNATTSIMNQGNRSVERDAAAQALAHRMDPTIELTGRAADYKGASLFDHAKESLRRAGESDIGFDKDKIITRALHTTSDFPQLLSDSAGRRLKALYAQHQTEIKPLFRPRIAPDFKKIGVVSLTDLEQLERVNEGGEYKYSTAGENGESYQITTVGRIFSLSRQAIVNDDLAAFAQLPKAFSNLVRRSEANAMGAALWANFTMWDNQALFSPAHDNMLAAEPFGYEAVTKAMQKLRLTRTRFGDVMDLRPRYLIVPVELESQARKIVAEITPAKSEDVNPLAGKLEVMVEPRLDDNAVSGTWFLAADPTDKAAFEFALLAGNEEPFVDERVGFNVDGIEFKLRHDYGFGIIDHRPIVMGLAT